MQGDTGRSVCQDTEARIERNWNWQEDTGEREADGQWDAAGEACESWAVEQNEPGLGAGKNTGDNGGMEETLKTTPENSRECSLCPLQSGEQIPRMPEPQPSSKSKQ